MCAMDGTCIGEDAGDIVGDLVGEGVFLTA